MGYACFRRFTGCIVSHKWWQVGTVYQVYPRSFQDSNGDGIGDLDGIRQRLDYLVWLGVDAIWISPIYPSPMDDFGYDVADYCGIDLIFGSLESFERLIDEAHTKQLKVVLGASMTKCARPKRLRALLAND
jgi:alpha-glucosidase